MALAFGLAAAALPQQSGSSSSLLAAGGNANSKTAADECYTCGLEKNCCNPGGTWFGKCPGEHSWEDGHDKCKEIMKGQEVQVPQAPIAQDPKVSEDCLSWCFSGAGTTAQKVELCTEQDQCTGCDFCSESEVEKEVGKSGGGGASKATADKSEQGGSKPAVDKSKKEGGQEASACTSCGESNNCCTAGGSWFGQCPDQHSFEDGHKACVEGKLPGYVPRVQSDANDTGQGAPDQAEGAVGEAENPLRPPPKHCAHGKALKLSKWASVQKISELFLDAEPSNYLSKVGLVVHNFDRTEAEAEPWRPCGDDGICLEEHDWWYKTCGSCAAKRTWWSTSIINWKQKNAFADSGIILAPEYTSVQCSYPFDSGTMEQGCAIGGVSNPGVHAARFEPHELGAMMNMSMETYGGMQDMYNEVLVDLTNFTKALPFGIAAFVFGLNGLNSAEYGGESMTTARYVNFLDQWCLNESDVPLLKADLAQVRVEKDGSFVRTGLVFEDVSAQARRYLKDHPEATIAPPPHKQRGDRKQDERMAGPHRPTSRAFREGVPRKIREYVPPPELFGQQLDAAASRKQRHAVAPSSRSWLLSKDTWSLVL